MSDKKKSETIQITPRCRHMLDMWKGERNIKDDSEAIEKAILLYMLQGVVIRDLANEIEKLEKKIL